MDHPSITVKSYVLHDNLDRLKSSFFILLVFFFLLEMHFFYFVLFKLDELIKSY
jgi:hypothetical protein